MSSVLTPPALVLRRRSTLETVALDPALELGAGGEARVLALPGDESLVAKLYHEPTLAKARKVALMMADEPSLDASAAALAWPRDLLFNGRGTFAGFLMPRAEGPRVFELYNPSTRRHAAPRGDHALLHRVGANVAAAFDALHARGYVIGDVNESNVLVRPGGAVTLVDTDSMQVPDAANGTVLRSRVGKAEFTPPELQGRSFADFDRSPEHDRFGLAVLLFLLLMEGTHPFAGRMADGSETPPIEERIRRGLFPHDDHAEIRPPKLAPDFSLLDPGLRALFVRCFEDGHADPAARPPAAEWRAALAAAEAALGTCGENGLHRFGPHLESCPWCERAALLRGRDPFPATAEPKPERKPRGTNRLDAPVPAPARPTTFPGRKVSIVPSAKKKTAPAPPPAPVPVPNLSPPPPLPPPPSLPALPVPAWLRPVPGPSGIGHPVAWIAPAVALVFLASPWLVLVGEALLIVILWTLVARPIPRFTRHTVAVSVLLLLAAFLPIVGGTGTVPDLPGHPAGRPIPAEPLTGRLGALRTRYDVDVPPELLNREEAERELTERLFRAGAGETRSVPVSVWVRPDGTVDPQRRPPGDPAHAGFIMAAEPALAVMRFRPLTRDGAPIPAIVWVEVALTRPDPETRPAAPEPVSMDIRLRAQSRVDATPMLANFAEVEHLIAGKAREARAAGRRLPITVSILLGVLPDGSVGGTSITASHGGDPGMEDALRQISPRMRFIPPTLSGEPVQGTVWVDVSFDDDARR